ncbi:MAG: nucleotide exchange factor GrpE [Gammaproteobacteria bacterium]|nr:nucleotide exchange factor GrpE [Gammaproteobacteria bacterium]MDH5652230.1 nucleotide exchange factor GrpE [Gammaproteobacteria bacterium]
MSDKETEQTEQEQLTEASAEENQGTTAQQSAETEELSAKLAAAEAKAQENWDQLLRNRAEMENLRRRMERDLENAHKFALERFAQELLPVRDSLEMGLAAARADDAVVTTLTEGAELTLKMLTTAMEKFSIKEVHPVEQPFNPELHQAMSMLEMADKAPNTVVDVLQKGYTLNDRLIRPAMVVVSKAAAKTAPVSEEQTNIDEQA